MVRLIGRVGEFGLAESCIEGSGRQLLIDRLVVVSTTFDWLIGCPVHLVGKDLVQNAGLLLQGGHASEHLRTPFNHVCHIATPI